MRLRNLVPLLALGLVAGPLPASACFEVDTPPRPVVWFTSATTAKVALEGAAVKSAGINPGDHCAVGLGHSGTLITAVTALAVADDVDPEGAPIPLPGLAFSTNATTTSDFTTAAPTLTWQGFHSSVGTAIAGDTYAAMVFDVTVPASTTYQQIIDELQDFAFLGVDDANAAGNLLGTSQSLDGIVGVTELPYCYDDVLTAGEVCDGATHMGCPVGQSCIECSVCVTGNLADACKAKIIRDVGTNGKKKLQCYAKAAKLGTPVNPACLSAVLDLSVIWPKYTASCPQTLPAAGSVTSIVDTFGSDLATLLPLGATSGAWKCASKKFKASSLRGFNAIKCHAKAYQTSQPVDPNCLTKVDTKFQLKFTQAEAPAQCDAGNQGNAAPVATRVDQYVGDVLTAIPPP